MCIVFFQWFDDHLKQHGKFKAVVALNRDEFFTRPSQRAHLWENGKILAGKDLVAQGTWFGVTNSGKVGVLTNYRTPEDKKFTTNLSGRKRKLSIHFLGIIAVTVFTSFSSSVLKVICKIKINQAITAVAGTTIVFSSVYFLLHEKRKKVKSRGHLVVDFLNNEESLRDYSQQVQQDNVKYSGFNLIIGDIRSKELVYLSNKSPFNKRLDGLAGVQGMSNGQIDDPWGKVERGKRLFAEILERHRGTTDDALAQALLDELLKDEALCEIQRTGYPTSFEEKLAKIFIPGVSLDPLHPPFGTSSQSILLVTLEDKLLFYERSLEPKTGMWSDVQKFSLQI